MLTQLLKLHCDNVVTTSLCSLGGFTFVGKMFLRLWVVLHLWVKCFYICGWFYICGTNVFTFVGGFMFFTFVSSTLLSRQNLLGVRLRTFCKQSANMSGFFSFITLTLNCYNKCMYAGIYSVVSTLRLLTALGYSLLSVSY